MAIHKNVWLRGSRKRLGGVVLYTRGGEQISRELAANVANPRTSAQMSQRIKLSNVVAMYRANKAWMLRYAFENKPARWSVFNAFTSANLSASLVALTKQESAAGAAVVAPYRMTDGTLPEIHVNENTESGLFETDLYCGALTLTVGTTIGELSQALIDNNNGIVNGMQLSLVENFQSVPNNMPRIITRAYELIIDTTSTALVSSRISSASFVTGGASDSHFLAYNGLLNGAAQGFVFVVSHTVAGKTHVSPSSMVLTDPAVYDSYISSAARDLAIASYGSSNTTPFLDSGEVTETVSGDVAITPSILGVQLGDNGNLVAAGQYLGDVAGGTTVRVLFNALPAGTISYVSLIGSSPDRQLTNVSASGNYIVGTMPTDPQELVRRIDVEVGGTLYSVSFSTNNGGDSGSGVTG